MEPSFRQMVNNHTLCEVSMAFSDVVNINKEILSKISLPFGGGLGRLRLTCGAVSGMAMILGLVFTDPANEKDSKLKGRY